jgi:transcriptional regulator of aromatic amino acid metabolism
MSNEKKEIPEIEYLLDLYDNINECILCVDYDNNIKYSTPFSKTVFGLQQHELKQKKLNEIITDDMKVKELLLKNNQLIIQVQVS